MSTFIPELFGRYYLVDRIAIGGMAEIFRAKVYADGGFERLLVVKRILPRLSEDDEFIEMFIGEARLGGTLEHPNIVRIYDFGTVEEHYFIAMEHIEGSDMGKLLRGGIRKGKMLPLEHALYAIHEAARGLHYAHERTDPQGNPLGIVHRDVTPENLFATYTGEVKVGDFGIAKASFGTSDPGMLKGKFSYMSPEQATGRPLDPRSDVFALGVVLYELCTGKRAFKGQTDTETLSLIRKCSYIPPAAHEPELPEAVVQIIEKAMAPDPKDRFQNAEEMAKALVDAAQSPIDGLQARESFARWMESVFAADIGGLQARLSMASSVGRQLHNAAQQEAQTQVTRRERRQQAKRRGMMVLSGVVFAAGVALVAMVGSEDQTPQPVTLELEVSPAAKVYLDGKLRGEAEVLVIPSVLEGEHELRVTAVGYEDIQRTLSIDEDTLAPLTLSLTPLPVGTLVFETNPPGLTIRVDGEVVGVSPMRWTTPPGQAHTVEYLQDDKVVLTETVEAVQSGEVKTVKPALKPSSSSRAAASGRSSGRATAANSTRSSSASRGRAAVSSPKRGGSSASGEGSLTVMLSNVAWADVYLDGRKLKKQAPMRQFSIPAGKHSLRVVNQAAGVDHTESVQVTAGQTVMLRVAPN